MKVAFQRLKVTKDSLNQFVKKADVERTFFRDLSNMDIGCFITAAISKQ